MKAIVFTLFVLAFAYATTDEVISQIKRIDSTPLGKTILDTISLQIEAGDPLDRLLSTLHDLEDRYVAEQKVDDANHSDFQDSCNVDIKRYDQEIAVSDTERIQLEAKLEGSLYPQRQILQSVEGTKQKEVKGYQKDIDELDAQRAEEAEVFQGKVTEHEEATAVIAEARRIFADNIEGASFLQKGKISATAKISAQGAALVQKHFQTHAKRVSKFVHRKAYAKLFKVLATIASKASQLADQGAVGRIVELCDELLHKISESLDLERFAEDKRIQAYKAARHLLTMSLLGAQTDLANIQTQLASVNDNIAQTEATLDNTNQRLENLNEARGDRYEQCEEEAADYQDGRSASSFRDADRQVVSDTIGLVNQQLRTLKEQLALRLSAGDKFD